MVDQKFEQAVVKRLNEVMGADYNVFSKTVIKNNDVQLSGVVMRKNGNAVCPTIYLEEYALLAVDDAVKKIVELYKSHDIPTGSESVMTNLDKEFILQNCERVLVNTGRNAQVLSGVPHEEFLDLSITYRMIVEISGCENASMLITNEIITNYGIQTEELSAATRNGKYECMTMQELIAQNLGCEAGGQIAEPVPMYVFTNSIKKYGAAVLTQPQYFREIAERIGRDLYILPSSIHEVIVIPADDFTHTDELRLMVHEINGSEVDEEDFLSDNVYRYSADSGRITIA